MAIFNSYFRFPLWFYGLTKPWFTRDAGVDNIQGDAGDGRWDYSLFVMFHLPSTKICFNLSSQPMCLTIVGYIYTVYFYINIYPMISPCIMICLHEYSHKGTPMD